MRTSKEPFLGQPVSRHIDTTLDILKEVDRKVKYVLDYDKTFNLLASGFEIPSKSYLTSFRPTSFEDGQYGYPISKVGEFQRLSKIEEYTFIYASYPNGTNEDPEAAHTPFIGSTVLHPSIDNPISIPYLPEFCILIKGKKVIAIFAAVIFPHVKDNEFSKVLIWVPSEHEGSVLDYITKAKLRNDSIYQNKLLTINLGADLEIEPPKEYFIRPCSEEVIKDLDAIFSDKGSLGITRRGYLFVGSPGNGKTYFIKYLMTKYNWGKSHCLTALSKSDMADMIKNVIMDLGSGVYSSPCLLILEDLDGSFQEDDGSMSNGAFLGRFSNALDGLGTPNNMILIATTNQPHVLPESLINRPGRFDKVIEFSSPGSNEIRDFINWKLSLLQNGRASKLPSVTLHEDLIKKCSGLSMVQIQEVFNRANLRYSIDDGDYLTVLLEKAKELSEFKTVGLKKLQRRTGFSAS